MDRYFEIHTYSPYCGEENYYYVIMNDKADFDAIATSYVEEDASEWYDEQAEDEYGDVFWDECGYGLREITKEEYDLYKRW